MGVFSGKDWRGACGLHKVLGPREGGRRSVSIVRFSSSCTLSNEHWVPWHLEERQMKICPIREGVFPVLSFRPELEWATRRAILIPSSCRSTLGFCHLLLEFPATLTLPPSKIDRTRRVFCRK